MLEHVGLSLYAAIDDTRWNSNVPEAEHLIRGVRSDHRVSGSKVVLYCAGDNITLVWAIGCGLTHPITWGYSWGLRRGDSENLLLPVEHCSPYPEYLRTLRVIGYS